MNQERHSEVPVTYISSLELAEVMAYAENPHQNVAIADRENNLTDDVTRQLGLANEAGITAAKAYIDTLRSEVEASSTAPVAATEPVKPPAESAEALAPTPESFLTTEQLANVELTRTALVAKFEHLGAKPEDFKLVMHEVEDEQGNSSNQITLIHAADKGLDLGNSENSSDKDRNWNNTTDKKNANNFIIEVLGNKFDTRSTTDLSLLKALAKSNPKINEWVWRTGEPERAGSVCAPFARLGGGDADGYLCGRRYGYSFIAFRPAVVIAKV